MKAEVCGVWGRVASTEAFVALPRRRIVRSRMVENFDPCLSGEAEFVGIPSEEAFFRLFNPRDVAILIR